MSTTPVALESILACLQGVIPTPLATCGADGTPNVTYMSIVQYIDSERVGLSRQFFRKTGANLRENPHAQLYVIDPETIEQFRLDVRYLHTETSGSAFEAMRTNLEAAAARGGEGASVFRLRGIDVYHVERCDRVRTDVDFGPAGDPGRDALKGLDELVARVGAADDFAEATQVALQVLEDHFGFPHATLLVAGEDGRLFSVASNGYAGSSAGAEIGAGEGVIGVAAQRRQLVSLSSLLRERLMGSAVQESIERHAGRAPVVREIPLPVLEGVQSVAAVPLLLHGRLTGVLHLESERAGRFGAHNEQVLRIIGGHLAAALSAIAQDHDVAPAPGPGAPRETAAPPPPAAAAVEVVYYQADDSVFAGGEYVIEGVPGRILWKLLREHEADGRTAFTNRELRLDEQLGLPAGNDNLEARLVSLRRRLEAGAFGVGLERVARGRLALHVHAPLTLVEIPTSGPMQAAHQVA